MRTTLQHTPESEQAARELYATDWDEGGTATIYLPDEIAGALLRQHGWTFEESTVTKGGHKGARYRRWTSPNGYQTWERDEALQLALTSAVYAEAQREAATA